jgi:plastocyanin
MKLKFTFIPVLALGLFAGLAAPHLFQMSTTASANTPCSTRTVTAQTHNIMIMSGKAEPDTITAKLCDSLTITNMDARAREIAFGPHDSHVAYDGVSEKVLNVGDSMTITLIQAGSFHFHDHLDDSSQGYFAVMN